MRSATQVTTYKVPQEYDRSKTRKSGVNVDYRSRSMSKSKVDLINKAWQHRITGSMAKVSGPTPQEF